MSVSLQLLLDALASGPEDLTAALEEHSGELTPELAAEARATFNRAIGEGNGDEALRAVMVESMINLALGRRDVALSNQIDFQQIRFMAAETRDEYESVRDQSLNLVPMAAETGTPELAFRALVLAADSAFFASSTTAPPESDKWLLSALGDLGDASEQAIPERDDVWFDRFVSLLGAAAGEAMSRYWGDDEPAVDERLARLAAAADRIVPADYEFPGEPEKSDRYAEVLAQLSSEHGG